MVKPFTDQCILGKAVNRLFLFWIKHLISSFSKDTCLQLDKLEFVYMIPDTSLHQHNDVGVFDLDNLFCFQSDLFC